MTPRIVSTWSFSQRGNESAWPALDAGGDALDAVLEACRVAEEDPSVDSVGYGGLPDASGAVTLDGCVMRSPAECGSACALRRHLHPARVARWVMERTRHVMLAGEAADAFADAQGEPSRDLLAPVAREAWQAWRARPSDEAAGQQTRDRLLLRPMDSGDPSAGALFGRAGGAGTGGAGAGGAGAGGAGAGGAGAGGAERERRWAGHDTIGSIAIGADGRMAGACSTSGMPYKVPGRVGDSPIIGHGLYVDPQAGAATATGSGELIMGVCGAFLAVECLRRGASPLEAAREVVERIAASFRIEPHHQTAFVVVAPDGSWSSAALRQGFIAACTDRTGSRLEPAAFVLRAD